MTEFVRKYAVRIHGVLSCLDRMFFPGCLPIVLGWSMAQFLNAAMANPTLPTRRGERRSAS